MVIVAEKNKKSYVHMIYRNVWLLILLTFDMIIIHHISYWKTPKTVAQKYSMCCIPKICGGQEVVQAFISAINFTVMLKANLLANEW